MMHALNIDNEAAAMLGIDLNMGVSKTTGDAVFVRDNTGSVYRVLVTIIANEREHIQSTPSDSHALSTSAEPFLRNLFSSIKLPSKCCSLYFIAMSLRTGARDRLSDRWSETLNRERLTPLICMHGTCLIDLEICH